MKDQFKIILLIKTIVENGYKIKSIHLNPLNEIKKGVVLVESGLAKIYGINEKGIKIITDLIFDGEIFIVQNGNYLSRDNFYLEELKFSNLIYLDLENLSSYELDFLVEFQMLCYNERLKRIHQQKVRNFDLTLQDRILYFFFDFSKIFGKKRGNYIVIPNYFTHNDLSHLLKTCRQNMTTCLNNLKREEIILYNRKEIKVEQTIFEKSQIL